MIRRRTLLASAAIATLAALGPPAAAEPAFPLIEAGRAAPIWADAGDFPGVLRAAAAIRVDLSALSGAEAELSTAARPRGRTLVIVGTLGRSAAIDRLVRDGKLDVTGVAGAWEAYVQQVVERPMRGVDRALVIAGSDKRGTIFGLYDLAARIGVSPWSWWADVPITPRSDLAVSFTRNVERPGVRYRGIFINDEDPALRGWADATFGGFNHAFYERVFELILRLKGNYLWPAMWGKSLWDDDARSAPLADEMGVVLGNSHHEPMARAHVEWARYGEGTPWNFAANAERLRAFWREGMQRAKDNEQIVTIGMRGDGDEPMTEGTAIALLERIVADQRAIIAEITGRPAAETPQIWALYKEVQSYYDQGMRVPDDVTLLFADDNWGNIRRLPELNAAPRAGGYGVYYHFDYVGGPRNYKWLNTNQIERAWEQMKLAREYGADRIWIVNVGDIKPMEFPISFFLDMAWNPAAMTLDALADYPRRWAAQQFGPEHAAEIGAMLTRYTQWNARRKPELLAPDSFSLTHFREAERIRGDWLDLADASESVRAALPAAYHDAYFQLVQHPIIASANLNEMYAAAGLNQLYAAQGRAGANAMAQRVEALFARDAEITRQYHAINGGKWVHMMDQTHIGYTYWQQPTENVMPEVRRISLPARAVLGVAVEGDARAWPGPRARAQLPVLSPFSAQRRCIDVFNRGAAPLRFTATAGAPWLRLSHADGEIGEEQRIDVSVDWAAAPVGEASAPVTISGAGAAVTVTARIFNPPDRAEASGFIEADNCVAIEAAHFARAVNGAGATWAEIPHLGRTRSGVAAFPRTLPAQTPGGDSPRLEYAIHLFSAGEMDIDVVMAPTLNFTGRELRYAVSVDDAPPQIVDAHGGAMREPAGDGNQAWEGWVTNNGVVRTTRHRIAAPGAHVVKLWLVDPGLVFERIVVKTGPAPASFLGPPESTRRQRMLRSE